MYRKPDIHCATVWRNIVLGSYGCVVWTGLVWLRIETRSWTFGFDKITRNSWVAATQLQEVGLLVCSVTFQVLTPATIEVPYCWTWCSAVRQNRIDISLSACSPVPSDAGTSTELHGASSRVLRFQWFPDISCEKIEINVNDSKLSTSNKLLIYKTILNPDLQNATLGYGFHFQHRNYRTFPIESLAHDSGRTLICAEYGYLKGSPNTNS
jgi:hypothetical protein